MPRKLLIAVALGAAVLMAQAQEAPKPTPPPPKPKAKKVFTEDDLKKLRGRISVVGDSRPQDPPPAKPESSYTDLLEDEPEAVKEKPKTPAPPKLPENCPSARWARFVDAATSRQGLGMPEGFWHGKLFGNFHCIENVSPGRIAEALQGDYTMDSGSRYKIAVVSHRTFPDPETIVLGHHNGEMLVLVWKGRPYVLDDIEGVEYRGRNSRRFHLKRLRLLDPVAGEFVYFDSGVDKVTEISFSFYLYVTPR